MATIVLTGHRPGRLALGDQDGYSSFVQTRLHDLARAALSRLQPDLVLSGMALGWDLAGAAACRELGIPFHAYVPHDGQARRWGPADQRRYDDLLQAATQVVHVAPGPYASWKLQLRNRAMVDHGTSLLALWDGGPGGTANCVAYAETCGRQIHNLWQTWVRHARTPVATARKVG